MSSYDEAIDGLEEDQQSTQRTAPPDPYDSAIDRINTTGQRQLQTSLGSVADTSPETAAESRRLSLKFGVPAEVVGRNLEVYQKRAASEAQPISEMHRDTPATAAFLKDKNNAAIAKDDLEPLGNLEWVLTAMPRAFQQQIDQIAYSQLRYKGLFGKLTQAEQDLMESTKRASTLGGELGAGNSWFRKALTGSAQLLAQAVEPIKYTIAGLGTGAAAGAMGGAVLGPAAPFTALAGGIAGAEVGGVYGVITTTAMQETTQALDELEQMRDEHGVPMDPQVAKIAALGVGGLNGLIELVGVEKLLETFPGIQQLRGKMSRSAMASALRSPTIRAAFKELATTYAGTLTAETATEVSQRAVAIAAEELAKSAANAGVAGEAPTGAGERTQLSATDEAAFQAWARTNKISDVDHPDSHYDYRGYWQDIAAKGADQTQQQADGRHFPDTYKQHGHPTFSEESKYSKGPGDGGTWQGETFVPSTVGQPGRQAYAFKHRTPSEAASELIDEAVGAVQSFALGILPGPAMTFLEDAGRAKRASVNQTFFKALNEGVTQSKTFERLPEAAQRFVEQATKDGPVQTLYAPIESWNQYWQGQGIDPADMAERVTGNRKAYDRAVTSGEDLPIPTARYATTLAGTDHNAFFADELRTGPDEMNGRESQAFVESLQAAQKLVQQASASEMPAARADLVQQLQAAGVPARTAEAYANLYSSASGESGLFAGGAVTRAGMSPEEFYRQYGLTVSREGQTTANIVPRGTTEQARAEKQSELGARAEFLAYGPDGPLYNVIGGPKDRSTVTAAGLTELGIETPETPADTGERLNGEQLRARMLEARKRATRAERAAQAAPGEATAAAAPAAYAGPERRVATEPGPAGTPQRRAGDLEGFRPEMSIAERAALLRKENPNIDQAGRELGERARAARPESRPREIMTKPSTQEQLAGAFRGEVGARAAEPGGAVTRDAEGNLHRVERQEDGTYKVTTIDPAGNETIVEHLADLAAAQDRVAGETLVDNNAAPAETGAPNGPESRPRSAAGAPGSPASDGPAASRPRERESPTQLAARREKHYDALYRWIFQRAKALDPKVNSRALRKEFNARIERFEDLRNLYHEAGHDPTDLLRAIVERGGLFEKESGNAGELRDIRSGQKFGNLHGVAKVFQKREVNNHGVPVRGLPLDLMATSLQQDPRFKWVTDPNVLLDALDEISRKQIDVEVLPGAGEVYSDLGIDPSTTWWKDQWQDASFTDEETIDDGESDILEPEGAVDTSFNPDELSQSLFDDLEGPKADIDLATAGRPRAESAAATAAPTALPITIGDRQVNVQLPDRAARAGDQLVMVDTAKFDQAWAQEPGFHINAEGSNKIGNRLETAAAFIQSSNVLDASEVTVGPDGRVDFTDGRHRFAVLRDQGVTAIPVAMTPESKANASAAGLVVDTLDTGETQARLPDVGTVRELNVATPELEAPFSLTSEVVKRKGQQSSLFQGAVKNLEEGAQRVAELEAASTDEAMGVQFPEDEPSHFADGSAAIVCTNCAQQIVDKFGGKIYGWVEGTNPTSVVAGPMHGAMVDEGQGHDFAVVDDRYLVDPWAVNVEGSSPRAAWDLENPADRAEVLRLYGDPTTWEELGQEGVPAVPGPLKDAYGPITDPKALKAIELFEARGGGDSHVRMAVAMRDAGIKQGAMRTRAQREAGNRQVTRLLQEVERRRRMTEYGQPVYHGSPYKFGRFDIQAIGSGEGAQAYGWGLYFASNREVAEYYREQLAQGEDWAALTPEESNHIDAFYARRIDEAQTTEAKQAVVGQLISELRRNMREGEQGRAVGWGPDTSALANKTIAVLEKLQEADDFTHQERTGTLYTVDIPEDEHMLDHDKLMSMQPPAVQAALRELGLEWIPTHIPDNQADALNLFEQDYVRDLWLEDVGIRETLKEGLRYARADNMQAFNVWFQHHAGLFMPDGNTEYNGRQAYEEIQRNWQLANRHSTWKESAKAASLQLLSKGVLGLKYLDGNSRSSGEGSHNYVVFDDKHTQIIEYGQPLHEPRGFDLVKPHLTEQELEGLRSDVAQRLVDTFKQLPPDADFIAVARAGEVKRGWYEKAATTIRDLFGEVDAPRFAALLAAMSPRVQVHENLQNAVAVWAAWDEAGRPNTRREIKKLLKAADRTLPSWVNNVVRALSIDDPTRIVLSGPKVNSFTQNLIGNWHEVTNDAWMASFSNVDQTLFEGEITKSGLSPGKGSGYLAMNAKIRRVAARLSEMTGETWTPANVQETIWSWAKTLTELAKTHGMSEADVLSQGLLTDEAITSAPDFTSLLSSDTKVRDILEAAGYGPQLDAFDAERRAAADRGDVAAEGPGAPARGAHSGPTLGELRSANRLERARTAEARTQVREQGPDVQPGPLTQDHVNTWTQDIQERAGADLTHFDVRLLASSGDLELETLAVRRGAARAGLGTRVMQELTRFADLNGKRVTLRLADRGFAPGAMTTEHPGSEITSSRRRLVEFYKRFGFVENKGRNRDFAISADMYRDPTELPNRAQATAAPERATVSPGYGLPDATRSAVEGAEGAADLQPEAAVSPRPAGRYATRTTLTETFKREVGAKRVTNPASAVQALQYLTAGAQERFDGIVVDNKGKPLAIVGSFKGNVNQTAVHPSVLISEVFAVPDAAAVYFVHNHPSGVSELSGEDRLLAAALHDAFRGSRIEFGGLAAAGVFEDKDGHTSRTFVSTDSQQQIAGGIPEPVKGGKLSVLERTIESAGKLANDPITSTAQAFGMTKHLSQGQFGALFLDTRNRPIGFMPLEANEAAKLREPGRLDDFYRSVSVGNPSSVILHAPGDTFAEALNLANAFNALHIETLDIVGDSPNTLLMQHGGRMPALESSFKQPRRGVIRFGPNRQFSIGLLERADLSTFLHETGHFFLEVFGDLNDRLAAMDPAALTASQKQLLTDYQTTLKHLGVSSRTELGEQHHEQFARTFEAYLMEGKAPTLELQSTFSRFRAWLIGIYRQLKALNVNMTPEVRGVMDRLLASDTAIAQAEAQRGIGPMFVTAEMAGMTPAQFENYRADVADASRKAREELDRKLLAEVQREQQRQWKEAREEIRLEVERATYAEPVYQALAAIRSGENPDGTPMVEGHEPTPFTLSSQLIADRFGAERLKRLPRGLTTTAAHGLDPEVVADMFGFPSGDAMLTALEDAPPARQVIESTTQRKMLEQYGSILLDGTLLEHAQAAVANEDRDLIIRKEMRALGQLRRRVAPFVDTAVAEERAAGQERLAASEKERAYERRWFEAEAKLRVAIAKGEQQVIIDALQDEVNNLRQKARGGAAIINAGIPPANALRDAAQARMADTLISEINPERFWSAARQASQDAVMKAARQDFNGAMVAKQQELIHLNLYRAAQAALDDVDDRVRAAKDLSKPSRRASIGQAGHGFLEQIDGMLDRYQFAQVSMKQLQKRAEIRNWAEALEAEGLPVDLPDDVLNEAKRKNYKEMSYGELVGVTDALKHIVYLAQLTNRVLKAQDTADFKELRDNVVATIRANKKFTALPIEPAQLEKSRRAADWFASHRKIGDISQAFDGYVDGGTFWSAFMLPLNEASDAEVMRKQAAGAAYQAIMEKFYPGRERFSMRDAQHIPAINTSLSKEARLATALNWGNQGGRDRLTNDVTRKWSQSQVEAILDTLDARDWQFVQATWDYVNTFWPEIEAKMERVTGLKPVKVEAVPVQTKFGELKGGYYPLAYDSRLSPRQAMHEEANAAKLQTAAAYIRNTTKRGHEKTRQQFVKSSVRLELSVMFNHIDQVVHDLTHHETLIDVTRLLRDPAVTKAILETHGQIIHQQLTRALQDIAMGSTPKAGTVLERALTYARTGTQIAGLGLNFWTSMQQPLGLFNGMSRVGPTWVMRGLTRWLRDAATMENTAKWISSVSPMMAERTRASSQELVDLRVAFRNPDGWFDKAIRTVTQDAVTQQAITDSFLWHIGVAQRVADIPTWLGQFEKSRAAGETEERAARIADQAVLDSQGGGQVKDLAQVQRGGPVARLFFTFYSYGNTVFNATARAAGKTNFRSPAQVGIFLGHLGLLYIMPALATTVLAHALGRKGGDDDNPLEFFKDFAQETVSSAMNTMVLVRELSGLVQDGARGYAGPAGTRLGSLIYNAWKQVEQGELDESLFKALNAAAGVLFHYPATQVQRTIDGWVALEEGRTKNPAVLIVGPPPKTKGTK